MNSHSLDPDPYDEVHHIESDLPEGMIFVRQNDPNFENGATIVESSNETTGRSGVLVLEMAESSSAEHKRGLCTPIPASCGTKEGGF